MYIQRVGVLRTILYTSLLLGAALRRFSLLYTVCIYVRVMYVFRSRLFSLRFRIVFDSVRPFNFFASLFLPFVRFMHGLSSACRTPRVDVFVISLGGVHERGEHTEHQTTCSRYPSRSRRHDVSRARPLFILLFALPLPPAFSQLRCSVTKDLKKKSQV